MNEYFADLHIHVGRDVRGRAVKVSASRFLTVAGIVDECARRKGVGMAGIVDCHSPGVIEDLEQLAAGDGAGELPGGGVRVEPRGSMGVTILLSSEVETIVAGSRCHLLAFLPYISSMRRFSRWLEGRVTNVHLSSQLCSSPPREIARVVTDLGGFLVPAHAFTPHRGILGACVSRLEEAFSEAEMNAVPAVELGLSADADMADTVEGMDRVTFLSNSDAHSRNTIAREYNLVKIGEPSFSEIYLAVRRERGRCVAANFGLDPRLGKYHRTSCPSCGHVARGPAPETTCPQCGSGRVIMGVWDRVKSISSRASPVHPPCRPPYVRQVPLAFVPGLGPRSLERLIGAFGSEMNVLHRATPRDLEAVVGTAVASRIVAAREGRLEVEAGHGGVYGSIVK